MRLDTTGKENSGKGLALASIACGIIFWPLVIPPLMLGILWPMPVIGFVVGGVGLILGLRARRSRRRRLATTGIILCCLILGLSVANAAALFL